MQKKFHTEAGGAVEALVDEVLRLRGRILSAARELNEARGLQSHSEGLLLSAIVHAAEPPTVARIARSMGLARQSVQRTANELAERGLVRFEDNPHHKKAKQLVLTDAGLAAHASNADMRGQWTERLGAAIGQENIEQAVAVLRQVRHYLEHPESEEHAAEPGGGRIKRS